jgi:hypothetical protein
MRNRSRHAPQGRTNRARATPWEEVGAPVFNLRIRHDRPRATPWQELAAPLQYRFDVGKRRSTHGVAWLTSGPLQQGVGQYTVVTHRIKSLYKNKRTLRFMPCEPIWQAGTLIFSATRWCSCARPRMIDSRRGRGKCPTQSRFHTWAAAPFLLTGIVWCPYGPPEAIAPGSRHETREKTEIRDNCRKPRHREAVSHRKASRRGWLRMCLSSPETRFARQTNPDSLPQNNDGSRKLASRGLFWRIVE